MNVDSVRGLLLWCLAFNYSILLIWFLAFWLARDWIFKLHFRWFRLSDEHFDDAHYLGMAIYKIGILLFNLSPYFALSLMRSHAS